MNENEGRIIFTDFEYRLLRKVLTEFRNQLLEDKKLTDDINNLILKVIDAPRHKWLR